MARFGMERLALKGPVGNGLDNDPADVLAVKRQLHDLGLYGEPDYGFTGMIDRDTELGVRALQKREGLKIDGWLAPGGETERALNGGAANLPPLGRPFEIKGEVGNGRDNDEGDIVAAKRAFGLLGRYPVSLADGPLIDKPLSEAIIAFQGERGLKQTGSLAGGDETEAALRAALGKRPWAKTRTR